MLKRNITILFITVVLSACGGQNYNFVDVFPEKGTLSYETVHYNAVKMFPLEIYPISEDVRLCQLINSEYYFAILNNEFKEIARFGRAGQGPEEFIYAIYEGITGISCDTMSLQVRDWATGKLYATYVNMHNGSLRSSLIKEYEPGMRTIKSLGNGKYLCNNNANRYYFDDNGTISYLEGWDEGINNSMENPKYYVPNNQTLESLSRDSSRLIIYSLSYPILYLHSMKDGSLLNKTCVEMNPEEFLSHENCPIYFRGGGYVGDNIALLLRDDVKSTSRILIFNKDLQPLISYDVPSINTLRTDPETGKALSVDYENELIYMFDLSKWL